MDNLKGNLSFNSLDLIRPATELSVSPFITQPIRNFCQQVAKKPSGSFQVVRNTCDRFLAEYLHQEPRYFTVLNHANMGPVIDAPSQVRFASYRCAPDLLRLPLNCHDVDMTMPTAVQTTTSNTIDILKVKTLTNCNGKPQVYSNRTQFKNPSLDIAIKLSRGIKCSRMYWWSA